MKLLLALAVAASAAPWVVSYERKTKDGGDIVTLKAGKDGGVVLSLEDHPNVQPAPRKVTVFLSAHEALELSRIIATVLVPPDADKSFDELADESARKTDAEFCARAKTDWERRAFCAKEPNRP